MKHFQRENLCHDPVHGYIPFVSGVDLPPGECAERELIDHPWVQRMRHIHQLQTAWWVFPSAEHTRFQHVLGAMHLGGRLANELYESLRSSFADCPSQGYVEAVLRIAGLLHDVGHGPFGHFFDAQFLSRYGLTHEQLGSVIIIDRLGDLIKKIRRTPHHELATDETLSPAQIAWLICRPQPNDLQTHPAWLQAIRSLLSGIYTIDNMDFVLRDAYMTGYSLKAFDLDRLTRYSFFAEKGLTIHDRGMESLVRFMGVRAELFRTIYFHRSIRAIDLMLEDLFRESRDFLFPGNPLDYLSEYCDFTESSLLVDVRRWHRSSQPGLRQLGQKWNALLHRKIAWQMACQRTQVYSESQPEQTSIFSDSEFVEKRLRAHLPADLADLGLRVDIARHIHRPHTRGPAAGQNFLFDSARETIRPLNANELYNRLPVSLRICRIYTSQPEYSAMIADAFDKVAGSEALDDPTNM